MLRAFCKVPYLLRVAKMELKLISTVKTINKLKFKTPPTLMRSQVVYIFNIVIIKIPKYSYRGQRYIIWYIKNIRSSSDI